MSLLEQPLFPLMAETIQSGEQRQCGTRGKHGDRRGGPTLEIIPFMLAEGIAFLVTFGLHYVP
jgi:hypothetical protein